MALLKLIPIIPARFNTGSFASEFDRALSHTAGDFSKDFQATISTWIKKPKFSISQTGMGGRNLSSVRSIMVFTTDTVYGYVNDGTNNAQTGSWYTIRPRNVQLLRYQKNFRAKTRPGVVGSSGGGKYGAFIFKSKVKHPGVKPRYFSHAIVMKNHAAFNSYVQIAMSSAIRSSGHAI